MNTEEIMQNMIKEISGVDCIVSELLDREQLAKVLNVSPSHISAMQTKGLLLNGIKIGACKRWRRKEVMGWINTGCPSRDSWEKIINPSQDK